MRTYPAFSNNLSEKLDPTVQRGIMSGQIQHPSVGECSSVQRCNSLSFGLYGGRGGLVGRSWLRGCRFPSSKPKDTEDPLSM
ncbi:hypothetical protein AVEN_26738-1 [Araneus ventricosus]|uniref:Uncharacterized protein n=1 Tax=Araneus ventricosus TaxID=182803 RepID=A0A4Y2H6F0_ARAVE|nr:hypothetical protein AVEN_26738-1 [Araneus ventricosus]